MLLLQLVKECSLAQLSNLCILRDVARIMRPDGPGPFVTADEVGVVVLDGDIVRRLDAAGELDRLDRQPAGGFEPQLVAARSLRGLTPPVRRVSGCLGYVRRAISSPDKISR